MCLDEFLSQLFETGRVEVPPGPEPMEVTPAARRRLFVAYEADAWHFPGAQPAWHAEAAESAARWLSAAAMCLADRTIDEVTMVRLLAPPATPESAAEHYSADLCLRYLPDLHDLARSTSEDDPLVRSFVEMGERFSLSAAGMPGESVAPAAVLEHAGLRRLYLDRLTVRRDAARLRHSAIANLAREGLGDHVEMLPNLANHGN